MDNRNIRLKERLQKLSGEYITKEQKERELQEAIKKLEEAAKIGSTSLFLKCEQYTADSLSSLGLSYIVVTSIHNGTEYVFEWNNERDIRLNLRK